MKETNRRVAAAEARWRNQRKRLRLECRECEVICERVVSPWRCLKSGCAYVYSYVDGDSVYFGCMHKVFAVELDLGSLTVAAVGNRRGCDPYGRLRVTRTPLPRCRVTIEQAYVPVPGGAGCCNPTFFQHPSTPCDDQIRLITNSFPDLDQSSQG